MAKGESVEDSEIVHVLVGGWYSDGMAVVKEVGDGCTKEVEAVKVAILGEYLLVQIWSGC